MEYLLGKNEIAKIKKIEVGNSFPDDYNAFREIFKKNFKSNPEKKKINIDFCESLYIISNENKEIYNGELWKNSKIKYIGNFDYLYTTPLWDWWIYPIFNRDSNLRKNNLSIIVSENNEDLEIEKTLKDEKYQIIRKYDLNGDIDSDLFVFYSYLMELLPINLAREMNRINNFISSTSHKETIFLLRGGFFLKEFFNEKYSLLNLREKHNDIQEGNLYVDDCLGTMNTFNSLRGSNKNCNFASLNSTLPKRFYEKHFPHINFSLPKDFLNIYSCRLFEENPRMIGVDYKNTGLIFYDNPVRNRLIRKVRDYQKDEKLDEKVYKLALELFRYV